MHGRHVIASALLVVALLSTSGVAEAQTLEASTVFETFNVTKYRFQPGDPPDPGDSARSFFRAVFGVRATFRLAASSDGVDLATDPIYVSFGSFSGSIGAEREVVENGDQVVLRYAARALNGVQKVFIRQNPTGFRFRLRGTRFNLDRPTHFTLQIGDDVGQVDLATLTAVTPSAVVRGVVAARMPQAGASSAQVRTVCPRGTCRRTTDGAGRFDIESVAGDRRLTIDGSQLDETLSLLVRRVRVRPGTTDAGLVVLSPLDTDSGAWVSAGTQAAATSISYPSTGAAEVVVTIPKSASVAFYDPARSLQRIVVARLPIETLPAAPPAGTAAASAYVFEPAGTSIVPCADVTVPNPLPDLGDGALVDLFALNLEGNWAALAPGTVIDGGARIRANGALCELSTIFVGCVAEHTTVEASVTFRGAKIARVPVFVQGTSTFTSSATGSDPNLHVFPIAAGCLGAANSLRAYAALPLTDGYLSGVSAAVPTVAGARTDLGEIALAMCGDGVVEGPEECDGAEIGAHTCRSLGFEEGTLGCTPTCVLDASRCRTCGNGIADYGEECDLPDDSLCPGDCRSDCTCPPVCGDGVRNRASERCDGTDDVLCPDACGDDCTCPDPPTPTTTLPPPDCPVEIELTPSARALSASGDSGFEIGFTGLGHDRDIAGGRPMNVAVTCAQSSSPCGRCTITGLAAVDGRCSDDPSDSCETIGDTADECGRARCDAFFLPPLHNMWGGGPSCFIERLASDVSGFVDNESGDAALSLTVAGDMYFGVSPTQPCPVCRGDLAANDGEKDGTCEGGAFDGEKCDANGIDPTFGDTSFDCLPGAGMLGSTAPVVRRFDLSTEGDSLAFATPCDFPLGSSACACATCAGNTTVVCADDADCTAAGTTGPCNKRGGGALRKPNDCEDGGCTDIGDGVHGVCTTAPDESFCDGMLFAHGTPFLPCLTNADCEAIDDACHGDCGECTVVKRRSCFLDPIVTRGFATPNRAVLSDVLCVAPGASAGLDIVGGLAGPERVMLDVGLRRVFASEVEGSSREGKRRRR